MNARFNLNLARVLTAAFSLMVAADDLRAQNSPPPANFDPAQMRQRELERMREKLEVTDDAEWNSLAERITKILDINRSLRSFGGPQVFGGPGGLSRPTPPDGDSGPGPGGPPPQGEPPDRPPAGSPRPSAPNPEADALRDAVKANAPAAEIKEKLAKLVEARKRQQVDLAKAQEQLRQLLTVRQEAIALTLGLL